MNIGHYLFKPKHGPEVLQKVLECYCEHFLEYNELGVHWNIQPLQGREGWWQYNAEYDGEGSSYTPGETVWSEDPITGEQMTAYMMVLLIEYGVAHQDDSGAYCLTDTEIGNALAALSQPGSTIYSPYERDLFVLTVGKSNEECTAKRVDMTDWILSQ